MVVVMTKSLTVDHEQHVVLPVGRCRAEHTFTTGVRLQLKIPAGAPPQWAVWAFPNPNGARNQWEYTPAETEPEAFDLADSMVAEADPVVGWSKPAEMILASNFDELIRDVAWDTV
jgi:hypothetical protein